MPWRFTVQVTFTREWSGHAAGDTAAIEDPLARSLIKHSYAVNARQQPAPVDLNLDDETPAQPPIDSPDTGDNTEGV